MKTSLLSLAVLFAAAPAFANATCAPADDGQPTFDSVKQTAQRLRDSADKLRTEISGKAHESFQSVAGNEVTALTASRPAHQQAVTQPALLPLRVAARGAWNTTVTTMDGQCRQPEGAFRGYQGRLEQELKEIKELKKRLDNLKVCLADHAREYDAAEKEAKANLTGTFTWYSIIHREAQDRVRRTREANDLNTKALEAYDKLVKTMERGGAVHNHVHGAAAGIERRFTPTPPDGITSLCGPNSIMVRTNEKVMAAPIDGGEWNPALEAVEAAGREAAERAGKVNRLRELAGSSLDEVRMLLGWGDTDRNSPQP